MQRVAHVVLLNYYTRIPSLNIYDKKLLLYVNNDFLYLFSEFNKKIVKNTGMALTFQQFKSMIIKKAIHSWRNRVVTFVQLALPVIFTILALLIEANTTEFAEEPALNLNLAKFENPVALYDNPANTIAAKYKDLFTTKEDTSAASSFDRYIIDKMKQVGLITIDA